MARNVTTSKAVGIILKSLMFGGVVMVGITAPNLLKILDKPLNKALKKLDKADRLREKRRILSYMKYQGLIKGDYDHGLIITKKGQQRLEEIEFDTLEVAGQKKWDHKWRMVFYDIPETQKRGRDALTVKLSEFGFFQLQRSVWIHPFPCREVVEKVTTTYGIQKYVSYIESPKLDNQKTLIQHFKYKFPDTNFK